jgi:putative ABC transport system permease protein
MSLRLTADLQYAVRALRRARVLTITAVLTLAVGTGAVTAMFSVVDAMLIRSVPFPDPGRLVVIWHHDLNDPTRIGEVSHYFYRLWQARSRSFSDLAVLGSANWSFDLTGRGERRAVPYAAVSSSFFRTLGVAPQYGRAFLPEDDRPNSDRVVLVSHGFWQTVLGGDRGIVGQALTLNGIPRTVVGIMPAGFDFPRDASIWAPVVPEIASIRIGEFSALEAPGLGILYAIGRLTDGATLSSASGELDGVVRQDAAAHGFKDAQLPVTLLTPIRDYVSDHARPALVALSATCGAVLLIACINVSSLLLMRVSASRRLFAIRTALGATTARIVRDELAVAVCLSAAGTLAGLGAAVAGMRVLLALAPPGVPLLGTAHIDVRASACAAAACLIAVLVSGVLPALRAAQASSGDVIGGRATAGGSSTRLRNVLVSLQVGAALVLLLVAVLSLQSLRNIRAIHLGFDEEHLLTLNASLPDATASQQRQFSRDLLTAIRALPGVAAASAVSLRPLQHGLIGNDMSFLVEGQRPFPALDSQKNPIVVEEVITPGYFHTMGASVVEGRDFDEHDDAASTPVVIVSEALARTLWPGQSPLGRRLQLADAPVDSAGTARWSSVVGVVGDIRYRSVTEQRPDLYVPYSQASGSVPDVMIRAVGPMVPLLAAVRAEAARLHPHASVDGFDTMAAIVAGATAAWTFNMWLFTVFAVTALSLAGIGLYGLLAYLVSERQRELGVRLALGATPLRLVRAVMQPALSLTFAGLVGGVAAAAVLAGFIENLVYEVRPLELPIVALVCVVLLAVATVASYIPARRVTRINPAAVLRAE